MAEVGDLAGDPAQRKGRFESLASEAIEHGNRDHRTAVGRPVLGMESGSGIREFYMAACIFAPPCSGGPAAARLARMAP
jgi:hypothetical protein